MGFYVKEFEYLVSIVELGSITKAAAAHFVTQSTLTKFVQKKEAEFGTPLFTRVSKKLIPTYAGEQCIESAKKILALNTLLNERIEQVKNEGQGRIRLALHSSSSDFFFKEIYPAFHSKFPMIDLLLHEMDLSVALIAMDSGNLDMAIISGGWDNHQRYEFHLLYKMHTVMAVKKNHPIVKQAVVRDDYPYPYLDLSLLQDVPIIIRQSSQEMHDFAMSSFKTCGINPNVVLETKNKENALRASEQGVGVFTFTMDDPAMLFVHNNVQYLSMDRELTKTGFLGVAYNKGKVLSDAETYLLQLLQQAYAIKL